MSNPQVKIGVTDKDLEDQGVEVERSGMNPQIPDYLAYVLGFLLLWLVYTSYRSAVELAREPVAKIAAQAEVLKDKVEQITTTTAANIPEVTVPSEVEVAAANVQPPAVAREKGWYGKLEVVNRWITWATEYVSDSLQEALPSEVEEVDAPAARREPTRTPRRKSEPLVPF